MKRFDVIKTIQLIVLVLLAAIGLFVILRDPELYEMMAVNGHVRLLGFLLWILLGLSFLFLLYDFTSWSDLRRPFSAWRFPAPPAAWRTPLPITIPSRPAR